MKNISFHLNRKLWMALVMLLGLALPGFAQKITVRGYVDDETGEPLIGGQRIFPVGGREYQEYSVASLNIKNLMSPTPRNCVLNALILALKDSAEAFVSRRSK